MPPKSMADDDDDTSLQSSSELLAAHPANAGSPTLVRDKSRGKLMIEQKSPQPVGPPSAAEGGFHDAAELKLQPLARLFGPRATPSLGPAPAKAKSTVKGRAASQHACQQWIRLLREVREVRLFRVRSFVSPLAAKVFNDALPGFVESIGSPNTEPVDRQFALSEVAIGLANLASSEAVHAIERLEMTGAMVAVERLCTAILDELAEDAADASSAGSGSVASTRRSSVFSAKHAAKEPDADSAEVHIVLLRHGLVVMANLAWNGGAKLVLSSGCIKPLLRALAHGEQGATTAEGVGQAQRYACAALYNMCVDADGAALVAASVAGSANALSSAVSTSLSTLSNDPASRTHGRAVARVIAAGSNRKVALATKEQRLRQEEALAAIQMLARSREMRAAARLQNAVRLARDAKRGVDELKAIQAAGTKLSRVIMGRLERKKMTFGMQTEPAGAESGDSVAKKLTAREKRLLKQYEDAKSLSLAPRKSCCGILGSALIMCIPRPIVTFFAALADAMALVATLLRQTGSMIRWAVREVLRDYFWETWWMIAIMFFQAFVGGFLPILMSYTLSTCLPRMLGLNGGPGEQGCLYDTIGATGLYIIFNILNVWSNFILDDKDMAGVGFTAPYQVRLAKRIMRLPMLEVEQKAKGGERQLIGMMKKDVAKLDKVIAAIFIVSDTMLQIVFLLPSLSSINPELTYIVLGSMLLLMIVLLRQGDSINKASAATGESDSKFFRQAELAFLYLSTSKLLGLGAEVDRLLGQRYLRLLSWDGILGKRQSYMDRGSDLFQVLLRAAIFFYGMILLSNPVPASMAAQAGGLDAINPPYCMFGHAIGMASGLEEPESPGSGPAGPEEWVMQLSIGDLAAFLSVTGSIQPLCLKLVNASRVFQAGYRALDRVNSYLEALEEALPLEPRQWSDWHVVTLHKAHGRIGIGVRFSWSERSRVVVISDQDANSTALSQLRPGDIITEINGYTPKDAQQAAQIMHDTDGTLELKIRTVGLLFPTCPGPVPYKVKPPPVAQIAKMSFSYHAGMHKMRKSAKGRPPPKLTSATPVLTKVDMTLLPGSKTALIGRSGAGKSTVMKMLARLYQPTDGTIRLFGKPINTLELRNLVVFQEQDTKVLAGTLRSNLTMGLASAETMASPIGLVRKIRAALEEEKGPKRERTIRTKRLLVQWAVLLHQWSTLVDEIEPKANAMAKTIYLPGVDEDEELIGEGEANIPVCKPVLTLCKLAAQPPKKADAFVRTLLEFWEPSGADDMMNARDGSVDKQYAADLAKEIGDGALMTMADRELSNILKYTLDRVQAWSIFEALAEATHASSPLDVDVGERGKLLSGGQALLLCITRVLVLADQRAIPIVILDEPASALDADSATELGEVLSTLTYTTEEGEEVESTVIVATHNLTLVDKFTHACVMQNGRVIEAGGREELIKRKGHFYRYLTRNSGMYIDRRGVAHVQPERLKQLWAFASTPVLSLQALAKKFTTRRMRMGDVLYRQGQPANELYLIVQGQMEAVAEIDESDRQERPQTAAADGEEEEFGGTDQYGQTKKRERYQTGDDIGLQSVLDESSVWEATAKVTSQNAVLLELTRKELDKAIEEDDGVRDSIGALKIELQRLQSPQRLQMLWPFAGADTEALELVSAACTPMCFDIDEELFSPGGAVCDELTIVVSGAISLCKTAQGDSGAGNVFETVKRNGCFGVLEMLPLPPPGSPDAEMLDRAKRYSSMCISAKAVEPSIVLQLERSALEKIARQRPLGESLYATCLDNINAWMHAITPETLMRHWLLSGAAGRKADLLGELQAHWNISAQNEGALLVDEDRLAGRCLIVLRGLVHVQARRAKMDGGNAAPLVSQLGEGAVINAPGLVGKKGQGDVMNVEVVRGVTEEAPALILSLSHAIFNEVVARSNFPGLAAADMRILQQLANDRHKLRQPSTLKRTLTAALPNELKDAALEMLAGTHDLVVLVNGEELFVGSRDAAARRPGTAGADEAKEGRGNRGSVVSIPGSKNRVSPDKYAVEEHFPSPPPSPPEGGAMSNLNDAQAWGLQSCVYYVMRGALVGTQLMDNGSTKPIEVAEGSAFCTPLDPGFGTTAASILIEAKAKTNPCLVACLNLSQAAGEALEAWYREQAEMAKSQAKRTEMKKEVVKCTEKVKKLKKMLGHKDEAERSAKQRFGAIKKRMQAFSLAGLAAAKDKGSGKPGLAAMIMGGGKDKSADRAEQAEGASLEEELMVVKDLINKLEYELSDRLKQLKEILSKWQELQPAIYEEEEAPAREVMELVSRDLDAFVKDNETWLDVSAERTTGVQSALQNLEDVRTHKKTRLLARLEALWVRIGKTEEQRSEVHQKASGIKAVHFDALNRELENMGPMLREVMKKVQAELDDLCTNRLGLPATERNALRQQPGKSLDEELQRCELEAERLKQWVSGLGSSVKTNPAVGGALGTLLPMVRSEMETARKMAIAQYMAALNNGDRDPELGGQLDAQRTLLETRFRDEIRARDRRIKELQVHAGGPSAAELIASLKRDNERRKGEISKLTVQRDNLQSEVEKANVDKSEMVEQITRKTRGEMTELKSQLEQAKMDVQRVERESYDRLAEAQRDNEEKLSEVLAAGKDEVSKRFESELREKQLELQRLDEERRRETARLEDERKAIEEEKQRIEEEKEAQKKSFEEQMKQARDDAAAQLAAASARIEEERAILEEEKAEQARLFEARGAKEKQEAVAEITATAAKLEEERKRLEEEKVEQAKAFENQKSLVKEEAEREMAAAAAKFAEEQEALRKQNEENAAAVVKKLQQEKELVRENEEYSATAKAAKFWKLKLQKSESETSKAQQQLDEITKERDELLQKQVENSVEHQAKLQRIPAFEENLVKRHEMVTKVVHLLERHFLATEPMEQEFQHAFYRSMPAPADSSDRDLVELKTCVAELEQCLERLQKRADSDGIYIAMRAIMATATWKPKELANQMIKGPHALKLPDGDKSQITYEQLVHFLDRRQVLYSKPALAFLLQKCGSSTSSKKPIKIDKFVHSFETVVPAPLQLGRVTIGSTSGSGVQNRNSGFDGVDEDELVQALPGRSATPSALKRTGTPAAPKRDGASPKRESSGEPNKKEKDE